MEGRVEIRRRTRKRSSWIHRSRVSLNNGHINKERTMIVGSVENSQIRALVLCFISRPENMAVLKAGDRSLGIVADIGKRINN